MTRIGIVPGPCCAARTRKLRTLPSTSGVKAPKRLASGCAASFSSVRAQAGCERLQARTWRAARPHWRSTNQRAPTSGLPGGGGGTVPNGLGASVAPDGAAKAASASVARIAAASVVRCMCLIDRRVGAIRPALPLADGSTAERAQSAQAASTARHESARAASASGHMRYATGADG
jgi:hypothetical protein